MKSYHELVDYNKDNTFHKIMKALFKDREWGEDNSVYLNRDDVDLVIETLFDYLKADEYEDFHLNGDMIEKASFQHDDYIYNLIRSLKFELRDYDGCDEFMYEYY